MTESVEQKAMTEVADNIYINSNNFEIKNEKYFAIESFTGADKESLMTRFSVLNYGFSARTNQTLSQHFKNLRNKLEERRWNEIGINFSYNEAFQTEQLGLLPQSFFSFCLKQNFNKEEKKELLTDYGFWRSQNLFYDASKAIFNFDQITIENEVNSEIKMKFQDSCIVLKLNESEIIVTSRSHEIFFVKILQINDFPIKLFEEGQHFNLNQVVEELQTAEKLAHFFSNMVDNHWLKLIETKGEI